ncbi:MAG TPA: NADH-quinone oxidoreductase subunit K [Candidatus Nitrosotalea sp.]|nr:NADH-quinone oxidoreductase subunit K [Candidatus Nitrosotalea sp.]HEU5488367.1 NADH-quinone oxidoreductase subunit K [Candidatus Nitrosotalea sp.]
METIQFDILTISGAILLIATFGIVATRGFMDWLNAYRYQSIVLSGVTAIIGYVTGIWEIYIAAGLTLIIKSIIIPKVLTYVTRKLEIEFKLETNPYVSIRASVIISALLVALSYFLIQQIPFKSDQIVNAYLPVSMAQFFIGLFVLVNRRTVLSQVVGLLIIENGLFLFAMALTHGVSLLIEIGIFVDILVGILISSILLFRISRTFDSLDVGKLENLRDD